MSIKNNSKFSQRGMGMVEVLVAMLVLAIGVLGYSAMQVRAVEATSQGLVRSQAMLILRGLADAMRANGAGQGSYPADVAAFNSSTAPSAPSSCDNAACSASDFANWDAYRAALAANNLGIQINMTTCPGVPSSVSNPRQCLFAGWNGTLPTIGTGATDCISSTGTYNSSATCLMMEAY